MAQSTQAIQRLRAIVAQPGRRSYVRLSLVEARAILAVLDAAERGVAEGAQTRSFRYCEECEADIAPGEGHRVVTERPSWDSPGDGFYLCDACWEEGEERAAL